MLALPHGLGQMANRVVDRVVILVKATLPVSWSSCRIVAEGVEPQALPLLNAAGPKENCGAAPRPSDRMLVVRGSGVLASLSRAVGRATPCVLGVIGSAPVP